MKKRVMLLGLLLTVVLGSVSVASAIGWTTLCPNGIGVDLWEYTTIKSGLMPVEVKSNYLHHTSRHSATAKSGSNLVFKQTSNKVYADKGNWAYAACPACPTGGNTAYWGIG